jgi:hypothetical protein
MPQQSVVLLDKDTHALVLMEAIGDWRSLADRVEDLLLELEAPGYLPEGPQTHAGDPRLWFGIWANDPGTGKRWISFVQARREGYANALQKFDEAKGLLGQLDPPTVEAEYRAYRARLLDNADARRLSLITRLEQGDLLTEADWVLDVTEDVEREVVWFWAAVSVVPQESLKSRRSADARAAPRFASR